MASLPAIEYIGVHYSTLSGNVLLRRLNRRIVSSFVVLSGNGATDRRTSQRCDGGTRTVTEVLKPGNRRADKPSSDSGTVYESTS